MTGRSSILTLVFCALTASGQQLRPLRQVTVPEPPQLDAYVRDRAALIALGKAFFWDMQAGSDGRTACATCHFHAGGDHRNQNQLSDPQSPFPANAILLTANFPFRMLVNPGNRNSEVLRDTSMRVGSAGLFRRTFTGVTPGHSAESGEERLDLPHFVAGGMQVRSVTSRNSPSVINAVFNVRNFWDGRAQRIFTGRTPNGDADPNANALVLRDGVLERARVRLDNASLASQAVGPPMDGLEMSYEGRTWPRLGKKMLSLAPLAYQKVATDDSVLGPMANAAGRGLQARHTYLSLVQEAFHPEYWSSAQRVDETGAVTPGGEYTQAEYNFPLFWGLALQAYQATLVSDQTAFDRFMDGDPGALTQQEQEGLNLFRTTGRCQTCHGGAEFTQASFSGLGGRGNNRGFFRTGVRPASEDSGAGNATFKTPGLRNVALTGPYFHNGSQATLEQVVEFYVRGGDFGPNNLRTLNLNGGQRAALAAFMKALTDDRVRFERAPFDHPELCVPAGHVEVRPGVLAPGTDVRFPRAALERWASLPATGATGSRVPLQTFEELIAGVGRDGSRAHTLDEPCTAPLP